MARLEELTPGALVQGILADGPVTVVAVKWIGDSVVDLTYKDAAGRLSSELLYRDREPDLEIARAGRPWSFDGDGAMLRLVSEAHRISLAHLFDPLLAVHTSLVTPLPHQITAVYQEMLARQPLRFLLADDPGAGKTIMAGLLIKELRLRGDLERCLIVCPGSLAEQWQDELEQKFHLSFEILTNEKLKSARSGNWLAENPLVIGRLDQLSRSDDLQAKLKQTDWDLIVCDEAHKMSATFSGGEVKYTRRYQLGQLLSRLTRHFLLLTATPHNGKEADFQLFMALLDGDRFEGRFRDGVHLADASDLMRRLVKEQLVKFDGTSLFPERRAYTITYMLSPAEAALYQAVTDYVRDEFNRAEAMELDGRKRTVGFALTILQRRLASSPEAIYQSLKRRRERLEKRLKEEQTLKRGAEARLELAPGLPSLTADDLEDLEDAPGGELEETEERILDLATAARTIAELNAEIGRLRQLEELALHVRQAGTDRKWEELSRLLQGEDRGGRRDAGAPSEGPLGHDGGGDAGAPGGEMFDAAGHRRKLVLFTEHRDTLNYLAEKIRALLGRAEAVVAIHGGMGREERKKTQEAFTQDKTVEILIATDAAGEGINLQRAHLMVNYDLPWNPNRLEQRFGRIHRIGQTEVCHLWNLVAAETREGEVYHCLLRKLEEESKALGGQVFDVLGKVTFEDRPLRELLLEAIRYGEQPEVRQRLTQVVDAALDRDHLRALMQEHALAGEVMDPARLREVREEMERAEARRLQPHFIASFFLEAFKLLGGTVREREPRRYEITHVPAVIRHRDRQIGTGEVISPRYERIVFEKELMSVPGKPPATLVCPGHPLLDATLDLILERYRGLLKRGAVLVDPEDPGDEPRLLFYLEHAIQDARTDRTGQRRVVSRRFQFVEIDRGGIVRPAGYAPYLDYRPLTEAEQAVVAPLLDAPWLKADLEEQALAYAIAHLVPPHFEEVKRRREERIRKTMAAVKDRLTKEIHYWDHRAVQLREQEQAGKTPGLNSAKAEQRATELSDRLRHRMEELEQELHLSPQPPIVVGGALIFPSGLLAGSALPGSPLAGSPLAGSAGVPAGIQEDFEARRDSGAPSFDAAGTAALPAETARIERLAMDAVLARERHLGFEPRDVSADRCGYDIESRDPTTGRLRFIEVKGRAAGARTITITKNELLTALNKPEEFLLAIVLVEGDTAQPPVYLRRPFRREPDFAVTSVNVDLAELMQQAEVLE